MEFLLGLFVGFNFWLFAVFGLILAFELVSVHRESFAGSLFTIVLGSVAVYLVLRFTDADPIALKALFGGSIVTLALTYLAIGFGWMMFKWTLLVLRWKKAFRDVFERFAHNMGLSSTDPAQQLSEENRKHLHKYLRESGYNRHLKGCSLNETPQPTQNKERLTVWFLWWPFSLLWTLLGDGITFVARRLYDVSVRALRAVNKALIGGYDNNLK